MQLNVEGLSADAYEKKKNRVMGDVYGAIVKCWPEVAKRHQITALGSRRQTSELSLP